MTRLVLDHLEALEVRGYSATTLRSRKRELGLFLRWCQERSLERPQELTRPVLERYQRYLFHVRKADGQPLTLRVQHGRLRALRVWFRWLVREHHVLWNPAADLELPKLPKRLPRDVLTAEQVEQVLAQPDVSTPLGLRDRAMLEVLYSTGVRRHELVNLDVYDVDMGRGVVMIRAGKGSKDRVVPIGERAIAWLNRYLVEVRPHYLFGQSSSALFLGYEGLRLGLAYVSHVVRRYVDQADLGKSGACHLFRHTAATLMLEGGADIRFIQAMLGHENLETTQIYTHVSIVKLKEIHTATHPARSKRRTEYASDGDAAEADELLSSLAAEGAEEEEQVEV
jgi:integrase/recombinase XerD